MISHDGDSQHGTPPSNKNHHIYHQYIAICYSWSLWNNLRWSEIEKNDLKSDSFYKLVY